MEAAENNKVTSNKKASKKKKKAASAKTCTIPPWTCNADDIVYPCVTGDVIILKSLMNASVGASMTGKGGTVITKTNSDANLMTESLPFKTDICAYINKGATLHETMLVLFNTVGNKLKMISDKVATSGQLHSLSHYALPGNKLNSTPVIISVLTPLHKTNNTEYEEIPLEKRKHLHIMYDLPLTRPSFRLSNQVRFDVRVGDVKTGPHGELISPHSNCPASGIVGGDKHFVSGDYEYYHYSQHGIDDSGWGCAYRSLQTLYSWFKLNHYTNLEPPSHRAIQETLVKIGDKPKSFIGSKQWIGSFEVGFVLDEHLGVSCKYMTLEQGRMIADKGRELAAHFDTNGTPVMMGAGDYAFTLLGIDFNSSTGDIAFLILVSANDVYDG